MEKIAKSSRILIEVGLDEQNIPVQIEWEAEDRNGKPKRQACKAMLVSFFDKESKDTFKIDLWTKEMQVIEMDRFVFQTLRSLADTYYKATNTAQLASEMQRFVQYFGEKTEIIPPASPK